MMPSSGHEAWPRLPIPRQIAEGIETTSRLLGYLLETFYKHLVSSPPPISVCRAVQLELCASSVLFGYCLRQLYGISSFPCTPTRQATLERSLTLERHFLDSLPDFPLAWLAPTLACCKVYLSSLCPADFMLPSSRRAASSTLSHTTTDHAFHAVQAVSAPSPRSSRNALT